MGKRNPNNVRILSKKFKKQWENNLFSHFIGVLVVYKAVVDT